MTRIENILGRLEGVQRGLENHSARCPAHEDRHASLSLREANDGKVLVWCHAGCDVRSIVQAVGLTISDLFPDSTSNGKSSGAFALEELSRQRRLPLGFLRSLGLTESGKYICVPYRQTDGTEARPQLRARDGEQRWGKPDNLPIVPYGLDRLDSEEAALVEGASDCWTLWHTGFPALGIPGASMHGRLEAEHIRGLRRIYIVREADDGGKTFETNIRARLNTLGFRGNVLTVDMDDLGAKDPSELYMQDPEGFVEKWRRALAAADKQNGEQAQPGALVIRTVNEWLEDVAHMPRARQLFGDCWFEEELCILVAETNVGKSILAVQIGDAITRGCEVLPGFSVGVEAQPVLYLDFELSARQFLGRYSNQDGTPYAFAAGFLRTEVNIDFDFSEGWEEEMRVAIESAIVESGAKVVVVDNLTYLKDETEKARAAIPLMRHLNALKRRYGLSILTIAHTPKRDGTRPISRNDVAGSRNLLNLCDSCFAIGESHREGGMRYIKQLKVRETEFRLDGENVALLSLGKRRGFLLFVMEGYGSEVEHLRRRDSSESNELNDSIAALIESEPDLSNREIARRFDTNHTRVGRVRKRLERDDEVEQSGTGGTGVPVFHPSSNSGNGTLPESGTVERVFQGVPPRHNGTEGDLWDNAPMFGVEGDA